MVRTYTHAQAPITVPTHIPDPPSADQPIAFIPGLYMRPYQLQALHWMLQRSGSVPRCIIFYDVVWFSVVYCHVV